MATSWSHLALLSNFAVTGFLIFVFWAGFVPSEMTSVLNVMWSMGLLAIVSLVYLTLQQKAVSTRNPANARGDKLDTVMSFLPLIVLVAYLAWVFYTGSFKVESVVDAYRWWTFAIFGYSVIVDLIDSATR